MKYKFLAIPLVIIAVITASAILFYHFSASPTSSEKNANVLPLDTPMNSSNEDNSAKQVPQTISEISKGVKYHHRTIKVLDEDIDVHFVEINPEVARIEIVAAELLNSSNQIAHAPDMIDPNIHNVNMTTEPYTGYTLDEYKQLGRYKFVQSGGYLSSWSPPLPLGYIKIAGQELNLPHKTYVTNGIFCTQGTKVLVGRYENSDVFDAWASCMQTGTVIALDNQVVIDNSREGWYITGQKNQQSFICQAKDEKVLMGITTTPVSLTEFADFMIRPNSENGMDCVNAVSLSGGLTAGMMFEVDGQLQSFGNTNVPLPNVITIQ